MLSLENISVRYTNSPVLHDVSLAVEAGEIVCLLGPSGCGKTTLLRVVAGLIEDYGGKALWENKDLKPVPSHLRDFGLMFQDYALFPHLNVARNVAFGLEMRHYPRSEQHKRVQEMLSLVGLTGYERRDVNELSGGEKQRVALARSLAPQPRLLMLDEPLGFEFFFRSWSIQSSSSFTEEVSVARIRGRTNSYYNNSWLFKRY